MSNFEQLGDGSVMTTVEDLFKWGKNFEHVVVGGVDAIRQLITPGTLNNGYRFSMRWAYSSTAIAGSTGFITAASR